MRRRLVVALLVWIWTQVANGDPRVLQGNKDRNKGNVFDDATTNVEASVNATAVGTLTTVEEPIEQTTTAITEKEPVVPTTTAITEEEEEQPSSGTTNNVTQYPLIAIQFSQLIDDNEVTLEAATVRAALDDFVCQETEHSLVYMDAHGTHDVCRPLADLFPTSSTDVSKASDLSVNATLHVESHSDGDLQWIVWTMDYPVVSMDNATVQLARRQVNDDSTTSLEQAALECLRQSIQLELDVSIMEGSFGARLSDDVRVTPVGKERAELQQVPPMESDFSDHFWWTLRLAGIGIATATILVYCLLLSLSQKRRQQRLLQQVEQPPALGCAKATDEFLKRSSSRMMPKPLLPPDVASDTSGRDSESVELFMTETLAILYCGTSADIRRARTEGTVGRTVVSL